MSNAVLENETKTLYSQYLEQGYTDIIKIVSKEALLPIQNLIYEVTKDKLIAHDKELDIESKLSLNFQEEATQEDFSFIMNTINNSEELRVLVEHSEVQDFFSTLFQTSDIKQFPISKFRAQYPGIGRSTYAWHQDEGTWYTVNVKDLAYKMPATCWLSLNGADENNSIELIPASHKDKLEDHFLVKDQGYFNANLPEKLSTVTPFVVRTQAGEGLAFHPLTFHRSRKNTIANKPRFSIDIRYYSERGNEKYKVSWKLRMKRLKALIGL